MNLMMLRLIKYPKNIKGRGLSMLSSRAVFKKYPRGTIYLLKGFKRFRRGEIFTMIYQSLPSTYTKSMKLYETEYDASKTKHF